MDITALLLSTAFRHQINEPNVEAGHARFAALVDQDVGIDAFCDAVAACQRDGLIREPIRLPEGVTPTHVSLFDGSNEGLACSDRPAFSVQYHPEASPGPSDSHYLFHRFVEMIDGSG